MPQITVHKKYFDGSLLLEGEYSRTYHYGKKTNLVREGIKTIKPRQTGIHDLLMADGTIKTAPSGWHSISYQVRT